MFSITRLQRLGDARTGWRWVGGVLLLCSIAFALHYPDVVTIRDEGSYVRQTRLLLQGTTALTKTHPFTGEPLEGETLGYPVGTALVMSPFVWLAGWRGAFAAPFLCFVLGVLITARWLREEGRAPIFALVVVGFPAALVLSRVCMSDTPSLAFVALGIWLFWRGPARSRVPHWLAAGFIAGASLLVRESNVLLFAPFFLGALLRRESGVWALVVGGLLGVGARLLSGQLAFDDPFYYKTLDYGFSLSHVPGNLGLQALALLVFVPGGLFAALSYRGDRWPEMRVAILGISLFYLTYGYSGETSGGLKGLILGQRYFVPLLPLLAFCMAEALPRLGKRWLSTASESRRARRTRLAFGACALWMAGVAIAAIAVHPAAAAWGSGQAEIRDEIHRNTGFDAIVVTNWNATAKYFDLVEGRYFPLDNSRLSREAILHLVRLHHEIFVVFLDRSDSEFWQLESRKNEALVRMLPAQQDLIFDRQMSETDRLRIWRLSSGRQRAKKAADS